MGGDPHLVRHRLHKFLAWCIDSEDPELLALARTIDAWWPEINAFPGTGINNARTEGYNRLVKTVKRSACGFRNREKSMRRFQFHGTCAQRAAARQTSCWLPVKSRRAPKRAADPSLVCNDRHMLGLIGFLLVVWLVFVILGFVVKSLLWLAIVGIVLFVATAGWGWVKHNTRA